MTIRMLMTTLNSTPSWSSLVSSTPLSLFIQRPMEVLAKPPSSEMARDASRPI